MPAFSVIMPTWNSDRFVRAAVASVQAQTRGDWELLVHDDRSEDATPELLGTMAAADPRIKPVYAAVNSGAAVARNAALGRATGARVAFLDSDDEWLPHKLEAQATFMDERGAALSFGCYETMDEAGRGTGRVVDAGAPRRVDHADMLRKRATMGCLTVMLQRDAFTDYSLPLIRQGQDYALWLKLLRQVPYAWRMDDVIGRYRLVEGSISSNKLRKARRQWQVYREHERLDLLTSARCFSHYARNAIFRR